MRPVHCAAVDLGATSGRVIVGTWKSERLSTIEVHRFPNQFRSLGVHDYWDIPYLWSEVRAGLAKARARFPRLASVGVDAWAVDHVLVGRDGRPCHPVYAYRDARTQALSAGLGRRGLGRIYSLTGIPNYPYNTSLQLQETLRAFPLLARTARRCLFISDYFNFLLSGRMENEISVCSHSQLVDVNGRGWSRPALRFFGVPERWFTAPALSPARLGPVTGDTGLKGVESALVPGHDTACAFASMPAAEDGSDLFLSSGTWSLVGLESGVPLAGPAALRARVSNERTGDGGYRPLRSCLGLWLLERTLQSLGARSPSASDWRGIYSAAGRDGHGALIDLADSTLFNPADMRAAIDANLRRQGARPPRDLAGYARLICRSLGRGHADAARLFGSLAGRRFRRILMTGGGARNRFLCQATADACGLEVVSLSLEGTAVGNIGSQLAALGAVAGAAAFRRSLARSLPAKHFKPS
ncbi:MAG TPA: FGGY-family carbohydrate kinase [Opitutaceae bacterium]|jgi:rhamnulokinase